MWWKVWTPGQMTLKLRLHLNLEVPEHPICLVKHSGGSIMLDFFLVLNIQVIFFLNRKIFSLKPSRTLWYLNVWRCSSQPPLCLDWSTRPERSTSGSPFLLGDYSVNRAQCNGVGLGVVQARSLHLLSALVIAALASARPHVTMSVSSCFAVMVARTSLWLLRPNFLQRF